jgi:hypothetical protein
MDILVILKELAKEIEDVAGVPVYPKALNMRTNITGKELMYAISEIMDLRAKVKRLERK